MGWAARANVGTRQPRLAKPKRPRRVARQIIREILDVHNRDLQRLRQGLKP